MDDLGKDAASSGLWPSTRVQVLQTKAKAGFKPQLDHLAGFLVQDMILPRGPSLKPYDLLNFSPGHYKLLCTSCEAWGLLQRCELAGT